MKAKHLLFAVGLLTGFSACNNDEIVSNSSMYDGKGELIQLDPNFLISVDRSSEAVTRKYVNENGKINFLWLPEYNAVDGSEIKPEAIGLCWTGVNLDNSDLGPLKETGNMVYTNYKFDHSGWLYTGEENVLLDECPPYYITNGEYLPKYGNPECKFDDTSIKFSHFVPNENGKDFDYSRGLFTTQNTTVYSGEYIIYYPYNEDAYNTPVTAYSTAAFPAADFSSTDKYTLMSKHAFSVGYKDKLKGGKNTNKFQTHTLSSGAYIGLYNADLTNPVKSSADIKIKRVVLQAAGEGVDADEDFFITKAELSAAKIKEAFTDYGNKYGVDLYSKITGTSKTITATLAASDGYQINKQTPSTTPLYVVIPVLPVTIKNLQILIIADNEQVATIPVGEKEFEALCKGAYSYINNINLNALTFETKYYATNYAELKDAVAKAHITTGSSDCTVTLLNNITLEGDLTIEGKDGHKIVIGGGNIIVPSGKKLYTKNVEFTIKEIKIEDKGCCGSAAASITMLHGTTIGEETTVLGYGGIYCGNGSPSNTIRVFGSLQNLKGKEGEYVAGSCDMIVDKYAKVELSGANAAIINEAKLDIMAVGTLANDGTIEMSDNSTFENKGEIHNRGNIDNNAGIGKFFNTGGAVFVDKVGSTLSGKPFVNSAEGEFICEVDSKTRFDAAIDSKPTAIRPTTTVRILDVCTGATPSPYYYLSGDIKNKNNQFINFEIANNTNSKKEITLYCEENSAIGDLIVTECNSLKITSNAFANPKTLTVNGDLTAEREINVEENLTITGDVDTNAKFTVAAKATLRNAKVLTVGGNFTTEAVASFGNNNTVNITGDFTSAASATFGNSGTLAIGGDFTSTDSAIFGSESGITIGGNYVAKNATFNSACNTTINGTGEVSGTTTFAMNTITTVGGNFTVTTNGNITFNTPSTFQVGTATTSADLINNGKMKFMKRNISWIYGNIANNSGAQIEIENAVGSDVAAEVHCKSRSGSGTWTNNSYPHQDL